MNRYIVGGSQFEVPVTFPTFAQATAFVRDEAMAETLPVSFQIVDRHAGLTFNITVEEH